MIGMMTISLWFWCWKTGRRPHFRAWVQWPLNPKILSDKEKHICLTMSNFLICALSSFLNCNIQKKVLKFWYTRRDSEKNILQNVTSCVFYSNINIMKNAHTQSTASLLLTLQYILSNKLQQHAGLQRYISGFKHLWKTIYRQLLTSS